MDALLVIDMQRGLLEGAAKHDVDGVIARIDRLASRLRRAGGQVIFIQHHGAPGESFQTGESGWPLLDAIERSPADEVVPKRFNDAFFQTRLDALLDRLRPERVLVTGWATDLCVDSTVRAAVARGHAVVVVEDAHTVSDRPDLPAVAVIRYHHWLWRNLIGEHAVTIAPESALCPDPDPDALPEPRTAAG